MGLTFDDDIFSDTMIKCNDKFNKDNIAYLDEELINYFWQAFKMNTLRNLNYSRNKCINIDISGICDTLIDEPYNEDDYNEITQMIINEFGKDLYVLFSLHANGTPYKDLVKTSSIEELKYKFRQIRDYVRKNYKRE